MKKTLRNVRKILLISLAIIGQRAVAGASDEPRHLSFTYTCYLTGIPKNAGRVDVWIPVPVSDDRQTVKLLSVSEPNGSFTTETKYGNKMYYLQYFPKKNILSDTVRIVFTYDVILREKSVAEAKGLAPLPKVKPGEDFQVYLKGNRLIPLKGPILKLRDAMDLPGEPIIAGKKVYDNLISTMVYNYKAPGAGLGDAIWACDSKTGDCSDYHSVFIGICRSSGIPADHEFGIPLRVARPNTTIKDWHCWAKFWVQGPGWITIDASEADKHPELKEYLFGTLSNEYLTISHGRDVNMMPKQKGEPLNIFADPYSEIDGKLFPGIKWIGIYQPDTTTNNQ
jgi:hypothetical protein